MSYPLQQTIMAAVLLMGLVAHPSHSATPLPEIHRVSAPFARQSRDWVATVELPTGTKRFSIAVRLSADAPVSGLLLRITDTNGVPLVSAAATVSRGEERIALKEGAVHLTPRFVAPNATSKVLVRIVGDGGEAPPLQVLSSVVDVAAPTRTQAFVDDDSRELCSELPQKKFARSVARLSIPTNTGALSYCTGFSIGANHLLTNHHCVAQFAQGDTCKNIQIEFNYSCSSQRVGVVQPECVRIISRHSGDLDYAVIEYKLAPGDSVPPLEPARAVAGMGLPFLLHHSAGTAMRIGTTKSPIGVISASTALKQKISDARADCMASVYSVDDQFLEPTPSDLTTVITHSINTTGGASGAPVLVGDRVVGLHFDRDRRYYPKSGCFDAGVENCMTRRLGLPNWAMQVCDVLADIPSSIQGLRRCKP